MFILFLLVILPLLVVIAIILGAIWMSNILAGEVVGKKHHLLEEIVNTGEVPHSWTSNSMAWSSQDTKAQERQRKRLLRKLDDLSHYVRNTPLVADEETREVLLARLVEVRDDWMAREDAYVVNHQVAKSSN